VNTNQLHFSDRFSTDFGVLVNVQNIILAQFLNAIIPFLHELNAQMNWGGYGDVSLSVKAPSQLLLAQLKAAHLLGKDSYCKS